MDILSTINSSIQVCFMNMSGSIDELQDKDLLRTRKTTMMMIRNESKYVVMFYLSSNTGVTIEDRTRYISKDQQDSHPGWRPTPWNWPVDENWPRLIFIKTAKKIYLFIFLLKSKAKNKQTMGCNCGTNVWEQHWLNLLSFHFQWDPPENSEAKMIYSFLLSFFGCFPFDKTTLYYSFFCKGNRTTEQIMR